MNILNWCLTLGLLIWLMVEAVTFHKATHCRQEAWLKSTELITQGLLYGVKKETKGTHLACKLYLSRKKETVTWQRLPDIKKHQFTLELDGNL
jgi:hypothetical protein